MFVLPLLQQELIGHCSAVYSINRATVLALEQHLAQYGYQQPADAVLEPESLQGMQMLDDTEGEWEGKRPGSCVEATWRCLQTHN